MSSDEYQYRTSRHRPYRLSKEQAGWESGFTADNISSLMGAGLIPACGHPKRNAIRYVARVVLEQLCANPKWLGKATDFLYEETRIDNARRQGKKVRRLRKKNSGLDTYSTTGGEIPMPGDEPGA